MFFFIVLLFVRIQYSFTQGSTTNIPRWFSNPPNYNGKFVITSVGNSKIDALAHALGDLAIMYDGRASDFKKIYVSEDVKKYEEWKKLKQP